MSKGFSGPFNGVTPAHLPLNSPMKKSVPTRSIFSGEVHHSPGGSYPTNRVRGSEVFRRYADGRLDVDYAKHKVYEALQTKDERIPLTNHQDMAIAVVFPELSTVKPEFAKIGTPLSAGEVKAVRRSVIDFVRERMNYNAGVGGGSVLPRSSTDTGVP